MLPSPKQPAVPAERTCAVCGETASRVVLIASSASGAEPLVRCGACGLVQVARLPGAAELASYYEAYSYGQSPAWHLSPGLQHSLRQLARSFEAVRATNRLLDVGCGAGHLLRAAREQGWHVSGVELSRVAVDRLREEGLSVTHGELVDLPLPEGEFDVVVMAEVVEHLSAPVAYVKACWRVLRQGGLLYITTPNMGSFTRRVLGARWRAIQVPEHLYYFSVPSLRALLRAGGFANRAMIKTEGINPAELMLAVRHRRAADVQPAREAATALLDACARNAGLAATKRAVNSALSLSQLGDSLKARVRK